MNLNGFASVLNLVVLNKQNCYNIYNDRSSIKISKLGSIHIQCFNFYDIHFIVLSSLLNNNLKKIYLLQIFTVVVECISFFVTEVTFAEVFNLNKTILCQYDHSRDEYNKVIVI